MGESQSHIDRLNIKISTKPSTKNRVEKIATGTISPSRNNDGFCEALLFYFVLFNKTVHSMHCRKLVVIWNLLTFGY